MKIILRPILALTLLILSGCEMGRDYEPPPVSVPNNWQSLYDGHDAGKIEVSDLPGSEIWWKLFADDTLNKLIEKALANNNDIKIAQLRIDEARANIGSSYSVLFPQIDASVNGATERFAAASSRLHQKSLDTRFNGSWEIDIFGASRRRLEAASANEESEIARSEQTRLLIITEIARSYVNYRSLQQQYALTEKNYEMQNETLKVTIGQREEGAISDLEVLRAKAQAGLTRSKLPQIRNAQFASLNRLTVLTAEKFTDIAAMLEAVAPIPIIVDSARIVSSPLETIHSRPDIKASERQLAAASALSNSALADFFPKLSLEGFFGIGDSKLYGNSTPWSASVNALLPLLNFGRLSSQLDAADARQQQAFYNYQQTILLAVEETENAFSSYLHEAERSEILSVIVRQQAQAADIAREQYRSGVTTQLDLLTAENNQLDAETNLALSQQAIAEDIILLYRALGDTGSAEPEKPRPVKSYGSQNTVDMIMAQRHYCLPPAPKILLFPDN